MNETEWNSWNDSLKEKLGEDNYNLITGEIGELLTRNNSFLETISTKDTEIENLKSNNKKLSHANAQLLQSIPVANLEPQIKESEPQKEFSFYDMFDKNGRFIR